MAKRKHHKSTLCRIREVRALAREHYEEGNHSKCYRAIWRRHVYPRYGISYWTFMEYINEPEASREDQEDK
jgi:hypothetical protein